MAAFIQGAHPASFLGLGISASHALSIAALHVSTFSKEELKHLIRFKDLVRYPQIVRTKREWSES
jgi:hypothetical protein